MNRIKEKLIKDAQKKHKNIFPCGVHEKFDKCFTREKNRMLFWFNTKDHSTHILVSDMP